MLSRGWGGGWGGKSAKEMRHFLQKATFGILKEYSEVQDDTTILDISTISKGTFVDKFQCNGIVFQLQL